MNVLLLSVSLRFPYLFARHWLAPARLSGDCPVIPAPNVAQAAGFGVYAGPAGTGE